jgi:hypothetical protein
LVPLRCLPCSSWYAETFVYDLEFFIVLMLLFCWSGPNAFKMLMKDFKLFISQFGIFNMLKEFCLWIWNIGLWIQTLHHSLVNVGKLFLVWMGCAWTWGEIGSPSLINV